MSAVRSLRLAYIGAGNFTNTFMYPQLQRHPLELAAVCDLQRDRAELAARRYGFAEVYTDFHQMLDAVRPDLVICIGGPQVHYKVGREVLAAGYPLYVQKSPAPSVATTQELADLAAARNLVCHVGFNMRSSRAVRFAREAIARPEFGPLTLLNMRYGLCSGATLYDAVMDQHCHAYDLFRHLGGDVTDVRATLGAVPGERSYVVSLRLASGAVGTLTFTNGQILDQEFFYFEVTGANGHFVTSHDFNATYLSAGQPAETAYPGNYGQIGNPLDWLGYVPDLASFLSAVRDQTPDICPVADTVGTMALCEEVWQQLSAQGAE